GYINARSALDWAEAHFRPTQLVVAGASAGSIAAPFYGQLLARAWPQADVAVISDASGGYRSGAVNGLLHTWGTPQILRQAGDYDQLAAETADFEDLTIQAGLRAKQLRFLHYNTARDESQRFFLSLLGAAADADLVTKIRANEADIRSELPGRFTSFTDTGVEHMILAYPRFYERAVAGTSFRDMVAAFLDGDVRPAVDCGICQQ
ncbi:MAG: hypothetical protein KDI36_00810, partial [Pseudomonadales bacterium]|nr:hypothetical protein [Pseudomonadales bacterium]